MKTERFSVNSCCGAPSIIFKIGRSIDMNLLNIFKGLGFNESQHFTKVGILYVDNLEFIITGPIGSNKLQVKCKKSDCEKRLIEFEIMLQQIE